MKRKPVAREAELERQFEGRALEVDARWKQDVQQREEAAQTRLKQREQQLQAQAEARLSEVQTQAEQELRRREAELERQLEAQSREADARLKQELQQKELAFQAKLKQREQELAIKADARETELQNQWAADLRARQEEWEVQAESRVRATETRLSPRGAAEGGGRPSQGQAARAGIGRPTDRASGGPPDGRAGAMGRGVGEKSARRRRTYQGQLARSREGARRSPANRLREHPPRADLEKKLTEASSFLNGWRNGKSLVEVEAA